MKIIKHDQPVINSDSGMHGDNLRNHVSRCRNEFKSSWRNLAQALYTVWKDKYYKEWGYQTFDYYVAKEVFIRKNTAMKLIRSYRFLEEEEPQYLQENVSDDREQRVPGFEDVEVLRQARRHLDQNGYQSIKQELFEKGRDAQIVKKDLTALIRQRKEVDFEEERIRQNQVIVRRCLSTLKSLKREIEMLKILPGTIVKDIDALLARIESGLGSG